VRFRIAAALWIFFSYSPAAQAGLQLFEASWSVKAFGNERTGGTGESSMYSAFGLPQGVQCDPNQPRCPFESTPTDGSGHFDPFGGSLDHALFCAPWADWQGRGTTERPMNGSTPSGRGTIQLVSPSLTQWIDASPASHWTAGIGILRIQFLPEPRAFAMLIVGIAALAVAARLRGSRV